MVYLRFRLLLKESAFKNYSIDKVSSLPRDCFVIPDLFDVFSDEYYMELSIFDDIWSEAMRKLEYCLWQVIAPHWRFYSVEYVESSVGCFGSPEMAYDLCIKKMQTLNEILKLEEKNYVHSSSKT